MAFKDALTRRPREEAGPTTNMGSSGSNDKRRAPGVELDGTLSIGGGDIGAEHIS